MISRGRLLRQTNGLIGSLLVACVVAAALAGLTYTPHDPLLPDFRARLLPPSPSHPFGTDDFGRDVLSRVLAAAGVSAAVSLAVASFAVVAGSVLGLAAGYLGGWVDRIVSALMDAFMAFPGLLLALGIMTVIGPDLAGVVLALGLAYTPSVMRLMRGTVLSLREREFVEASRALGNPGLVTIARHVVPNSLAPLTVLATLIVGWAILAESALSFLGLGVPPPAPTWGNMLADSRQHIGAAPWLGVAPGVAISVALVGINLLGDALRDVLDPRMAPRA